MRLKHFLSVFLTLLTLSVGQMWGADVNDPDNVVSGSQYLIKAVKSTTNYYLVAPTSSGRGSSTTTKANATVFTMTKESNKWYVTFTKNDVTYYLSGSTTNGNVTINTNKTECTVFEKSGNYIKIGTTKWIQLNSSSTTIMGCYSSSQTGVVLEPVASSFTVEWSITSGGGTLSATSGTSTTVTPTSGWRYADPAYTVLTGASVVSQSTNTFTATPTQNSTIQINMEEIPSHKIHFNTGGLVEIASVDVLEGETYNITQTPTASLTPSCEYGTFVGWTTASSIANPSVKPALVSNVTMSTSGVTLYAVYSKTTGGGGEESDSKTFTFSSIASANSWENSVAYTEVTISPVTINAKGGGNNGKWYTSGGGSWRMYSGGTLEISVTGGSVSSVTSSPECNFTISNGKASFSPSARTDFTEIIVNYTATSAGTTTYSLTPNCCQPLGSINGSFLRYHFWGAFWALLD